MDHLDRLVVLMTWLLLGLPQVQAQRFQKWAVRGDSLLRTGETPEALGAYERSFRIRTNSQAAFGIAECYRGGMDIGSDSLWYRKAVLLSKQEYTDNDRAQEKIAALYRIAYAYQRLDEHEEAVKWFSKDNCHGRAVYLDIGRSLMALKDYPAALEAFRKYDLYFPGRRTEFIQECEQVMGQ